MAELKRRKNTGQVTLSDVAKRAGVGTMTVSRALRTPQQVSDKLREKIHSAIAELGYRPNLAASMLASARPNRRIVIVLPQLYSNGLENLVPQIQLRFQQRGYLAVLIACQYVQSAEKQLLTTLSDYNPAAIMLINIEDHHSLYHWLQERHLPAVSIGSSPTSSVDINIGINNAQGMYNLTRYVQQKGYKNIGLLCANQDQVIFRQRIAGWHNAMLEQHMSVHRVIHAGDIASFETGAQLLPEFVLNWPELDALICMTDELAAGALYECQRRHIRVPVDLAIAGFGDNEFSRVTCPPLTTVALPYARVAQHAVESLLAQLNGETPQSAPSLDPSYRLHVRHSL